MWRAIRFGLDGRMIDLRARRGVSGARGDRAAGRLDRADPRASSASSRSFPERNGAQRQRAMIEAGATREEVFAASVARDRADLLRGGDGVSTDPTAAPMTAARPAAPGQPERRGAARSLRGRTEPHHERRHDAAGGGLAAEHRQLPARRAGAGAAGAQAAAPGAARDLEQVRDAIDGVRALLEILERTRSAASWGRCATRSRSCRWHMRARSQASGAQSSPAAAPSADEAEPASGASPGARPAGDGDPAGQGKSGPGPAESSGRLWVPGR